MMGFRTKGTYTVYTGNLRGNVLKRTPFKDERMKYIQFFQQQKHKSLKNSYKID